MENPSCLPRTRSRFLVKLISCFDFGSALSFLWSMDNPVSCRLSSTLLNLLKPSRCCQILTWSFTRYFYQLVVPLNPEFNCFQFSWVYRVTAGTQSLVLAFVNFPAPDELVMAQFSDHFSWIITSQLLKDISIILRKLLKYFIATSIPTFFVLPPTGVLPVILASDLNGSEFTMLSFGVSLWYCHRDPHFFA